MNENEWDKLLKIHTTGTDNTDADQYRYPYEPTPYSVLERLGNSGWIRKENTLLDYGCGKGRVDFFLSYQTRCHSVGIEYNERIYAKAVENKETAVSAERVDFVVENPVAGGSGPHLFFQSFFFGNFTESDGAYPGILL